MTLLQIQYFLEVAKSGNISSAANELFVSRPAVSRAMRDLEHEFGTPFFQRSNTGLILTEAGSLFYEACRDIQARIDTLETQMTELRENRKRQDIRLGLTPMTSIAIFPKFYQEFKALYPGIHIVILEYEIKQARQMLQEGTMDAFFTTHIEGLPEGIDGMVLMQTQLMFCTAASNPLAGRSSVTVEDIQDEPLVYMEVGMQREKEIAWRMRQIGRTPNVIMRTAQMSTLYNIVAEGIASAIQLHGSLEEGKTIVEIPLDPPIQFPVSLIWNRRAAEREEIRTLRSFAAKWRKADKDGLR